MTKNSFIPKLDLDIILKKNNMTLKHRISLRISIIFTVLFGMVCIFMVVMFSNLRKEEFEERLNEKAFTSIKLLIEVKEVDSTLLKIIDQNTINKLYNEKILIFDAYYNLIYSSLDSTQIRWTKLDLDYLKEHKTFFKKEGGNEIYGVFYNSYPQNFFALISANDNYGKKRLKSLTYVLFLAYSIFTVLAWLLAFYAVKRELIPLDIFQQNISKMNEFSLETRLKIQENSLNEIDLIGKEFNFMMNRIENAYQKQKEFTAQASHELRTPLARISTQIENQKQSASEKEKIFLNNIFQNIIQLNQLISSLLLLSKIDNKAKNHDEIVRVDEVIYNSIEIVHSQYKDFKVNLKVEETTILHKFLEVLCNQNLLEIVFVNLLKNAYLYSDNQQVEIIIAAKEDHLSVAVRNVGQILTLAEQERIFEPFMRGANAYDKAEGLGLGLRIVQRILSVYNFRIQYHTISDNQNIFEVYF